LRRAKRGGARAIVVSQGKRRTNCLLAQMFERGERGRTMIAVRVPIQAIRSRAGANKRQAHIARMQIVEQVTRGGTLVPQAGRAVRAGMRHGKAYPSCSSNIRQLSDIQMITIAPLNV
jgi:hypothetical protein